MKKNFILVSVVIVLSMVLSACGVFGGNSEVKPTSAPAVDQSAQIATQSAQIATLMAKLEATSVATAIPAGPTATTIPTTCSEDAISFYNSQPYEIWPLGTAPQGKKHWDSWPDGTLIVIQGNAPKGDLPYSLLYDSATKTYSVFSNTTYLVEWWNINSKEMEGIFLGREKGTPAEYQAKNAIVFHIWASAYPADCRYDGNRTTPSTFKVWPEGDRPTDISQKSHLAQFLTKKTSHLECLPPKQ